MSATPRVPEVFQYVPELLMKNRFFPKIIFATRCFFYKVLWVFHSWNTQCFKSVPRCSRTLFMKKSIFTENYFCDKKSLSVFLFGR